MKETPKAKRKILIPLEIKEPRVLGKELAFAQAEVRPGFLKVLNRKDDAEWLKKRVGRPGNWDGSARRGRITRARDCQPPVASSSGIWCARRMIWETRHAPDASAVAGRPARRLIEGG